MANKKEVHKVAKSFLRSMGGSIKFIDLRYYLEKTGWKVYLYNGINETGDSILKDMKLETYAMSLHSFLYCQGSYRLIFIRCQESEQEALYHLLHEIAHIQLGHVNYRLEFVPATDQIEVEAQQFVQYALTHTPGKNRTRRRTIIAAVVILLFIAYYQTDKQKQRTPAYFVEDGTNYHRQVCTYTAGNDKIIETTIKNAEQLGLQPCPVCQPKPE